MTIGFAPPVAFVWQICVTCVGQVVTMYIQGDEKSLCI
jgi:hypothetical protein